MKSWTVDEVMGYDLGYKRGKVEDLFAGRERLTVLDILELDICEIKKVWFLMKAVDEYAPEIIERIATRAVTNHALPCPETREWAERWLSGEDRTRASAKAAAKAAVEINRAAAFAAWAAWHRIARQASIYAVHASAQGHMSPGSEFRNQLQDVRDVINNKGE